MPKLKTRKSILKRFKISKRGKVLHRLTFLRHLRAHKSKGQKARYKKLKPLTGKMAKKVKKMLGKYTYAR